MSAGVILLIGLFLALPIFVKYLLSFETRSLLEDLHEQEDQVRHLSAQWRALEREHRVVRRAVSQVSNQHRHVRTRRGLAAEKLERVQRTFVEEEIGQEQSAESGRRFSTAAAEA